MAVGRWRCRCAGVPRQLRGATCVIQAPAVPARVGRRGRVAPHVAVTVEPIRHRVGTGELAQGGIFVVSFYSGLACAAEYAPRRNSLVMPGP
jgi:hypothetical protein